MLLRGILCWNRACRNFHKDVITGSDFSKDGNSVNNDPTEELRKFLDEIDENDLENLIQ